MDWHFLSRIAQFNLSLPLFYTFQCSPPRLWLQFCFIYFFHFYIYTTHSLQGVFAQADTGHEDSDNQYLYKKLITTSSNIVFYPLWIKRSNQPHPGCISIAGTKPSPTKHFIKDLTLIYCNHRLPSKRSEQRVQ